MMIALYGRVGGREDDRLRWVSPGKERTTSSHAQDGQRTFGRDTLGLYFRTA